jgi:hypothetical protein
MEFVSGSRNIQITVIGLTGPKSKFVAPNREAVIFKTAEFITGIYDENISHILESPCPTREEDLVKIARIKRNILKSCFNDCYERLPVVWINNVIQYYSFTQVLVHNFGETPFVLGDAIVIDLSADECFQNENHLLIRDCPRDIPVVVSNFPSPISQAVFSPTMEITRMASVDEIKHIYNNLLDDYEGTPVESKEQAREKLGAKLHSSILPCITSLAEDRDMWLGNILVLYLLELISQTNYGEIPFVVADEIELDMSRFCRKRA